ncbi:MAG: hypothetical protein A2Y24_03920 [Clostridiales bacterium GWE2_32_10]|nr:MAG: hypothetical protein A2Y24_03920 [Clostridiales bacterium GWE2_32_10]HBY21359.1 hypothetical protein [Clostridiales bacterium]
MKKLSVLLSIVLIILVSFSTRVSFAETDSEIISDVSSKISFYRGLLTGDINVDTKSAVEALKVRVNQISDYEDKENLMEKLVDLINDIDDILTGEDLEDIEDNIKIAISSEELYLYLPDTASRYTFDVLIENSDLGVEMVKCTARQNEKIALPTLKKETNIKYTVKILYGTVVKKEVIGTYRFYDTEAPKITYIYVLNDRLYVSSTENYKFADKRYIYTEEDDEHRSDSYYEIDGYPATVGVQVIDFLVNKSSTYTVNITEDDKVYYGDAPNNIDSKIDKAKESDVTTNRYFKNIVIGEYGKELYYCDVFNTIFKNKFGNSYNKDKVEIYSTSGLSSDDDKEIIKLNEIGTYELGFKYKSNSEIVYTYVVIGDKNGKITDYYSEVKNKLPNYVTDNYISFSKYITLVPKSKYKEDEIDNDYICIIVDDKLYSVDDSISFKDEGEHIIYIYNIATDDLIENEIYYKKLVSKTEKLNDIKNHWAERSIVRMIEKNVVNGHADNTFKPNSQVTVKEFIAMMNRLDPNKERESINTYTGLLKYDWAYYEVKNVLSKMDYSGLMGSGLMNKYDYPITREEVAFLVANYFQLSEEATDKYFSDLTQSTYSPEIQKLIANDIMTGYNDNTIKPFNNLTRAEAVTILERINN